ncbi:unnamed protein product [Schistocephalus solidus]|uniref:UBIQUITIN_CONJUGAT_2 domain-containing protein n=1 Tax=Schistocephalus solidus TaxID=70667 RepID=A0A183TP69_SCHSO|nr:unnamed protein product [Schistocephalus solidus]
MIALDNYPFTAPDLRLLTPIFHPNIREDDGYICVSLFSDWNSCYSFLDAVKAVLYLLSNPNFEDPNNPYSVLRAEYRDRFDEVCRQFRAGFPVKFCGSAGLDVFSLDACLVLYQCSEYEL